MPKRQLCGAFVTLVLVASAPAAQALTLGTRFAPLFSDERLQGCSLDFETTQPDHANLGGALSLAVGSFTVWALPDRAPVLMFKLGVSGPGAYNRPTPPHGVALQRDLATNAGDRISAEHLDPGYLSTIFAFSDATIASFFGGVAAGKIEAIYTSNEGGIAVPFSVDLRIAELNLTTGQVTQGQADKEFDACMDVLLAPTS